MTNDFTSLGNFSGNYYARPFDDDLTIISEYDDYKGNRKKRFYDVKSPQLVTGSNQEAGGSPLKIKPYTVLSLNESLNKYPNGGFETSPINVYCWSADGACCTTWTTTSALDQRAMKISGSTSGLLALECGAVTKTKQYLLRFSAIGQVETHIEVFLRQINSPWKTLSTVSTPTRSEYEVLFSFPVSENAACILFQAASDNFSYWLDNVKLMETSTSMVNPDDHIRFEYNPSLTDKTIQLGANYLDVEKRTHSGELVLRPFESIVLLKVAQSAPVPASTESTLSKQVRTPVDGAKWLIYPNVLSKEQSDLSIKMYTEKPRVTFSIIDQLGRILKTIQAETVLGWNLINWNLPADVAAGTYYLVHSENLLKEVLPFMVINTSY